MEFCTLRCTEMEAKKKKTQGNDDHEKQKMNTYMLMRTMPRDHTSAARGLYTGATLFLHEISQRGKESDE
jgi:hypothetical protein